MVTPSLDASLRALTSFSAVAILISGFDDLFIDVCYYGSRVQRRLLPSTATRVTEAELRAIPEQAIAVMIPAWQEDAVIARMLRNTVATVEYRNFDLFVGTYPNDEPTMRAVDQVARDDTHVHKVVCPHDGPTNKADCLNSIIEGIRRYERASGKHIDIFMLHDSEDLVHPLSFKLMNRFIPSVSMVQLPVIPFESPAAKITAGTYLDEFAELHIKDMVVRERLSGMVPSAGVGTGFSREAIDKLALKYGKNIFNVATFTEDYDLAFRLKALGERSVLLQFFIGRTKELVGTRGYFPATFATAVRQKARWTLGIIFHGWQQRGWEGDWALRYMIWRDRKALLTNSVNILGYALLLISLSGAFLARSGVVSPRLLHRQPIAGWVWRIILIDGLLLVNRCFQRMICIARVSSWKQAALSLPRIVWGNVINFSAVARATYLFAGTSLTGKKMAWAKTAHAFPTEEELANLRNGAPPADAGGKGGSS